MMDVDFLLLSETLIHDYLLFVSGEISMFHLAEDK